MSVVALILAGGLGLRMNQEGEPPKQFVVLGEKPILIHTLERFEAHPYIDATCIVCLPTWEEYLLNLIKHYKIKKTRWIVTGGELRQKSVYNGLCELEKKYPPDTVIVVHDGVRPFITSEIITRNIDVAMTGGSAMTGMRSADTLVTSPDGSIAKTAMDRDSTFSIQTPQTYMLGYGLNLYRKAIERGIHNSINCCELFIALGETVSIVNGRKTNIKLTTQDDIAYLEYLHSIFSDFEEQGTDYERYHPARHKTLGRKPALEKAYK
jgi:2-C-methyl-D-erythritol 4-phosphate cytidylyltransferase